MSLKVSQGAARLLQFLSNADIPAADKTPAKIQVELQSIAADLGLDAMEQRQACAVALAEQKPDFAAQWLGQVADAAGLSKPELSNAIGDALATLSDKQPLDKADFLAAMQAPAAPAAQQPGAKHVKASAIYAVTGNTGPLATKIVTKRGAVSFQAKAGATFRVVNLNAPDKNNKLAVIGEGKVSDKDLPPFQNELPDRGASLQFGAGINWMPGDHLAI